MNPRDRRRRAGRLLATAAVAAVARQVGVGKESLRRWVAQADVDAERLALTTRFGGIPSDGTAVDVAIDYTGHCALPAEEAGRRIAFARRAHPEWFGRILALTDAGGLGPFGLEIAAGFGIAARCRFSLFVLDKERLSEVGEAVEFVYRVFGTANLVITWGNDSIRPPERSYPPMRID